MNHEIINNTNYFPELILNNIADKFKVWSKFYKQYNKKLKKNNKKKTKNQRGKNNQFFKYKQIIKQKLSNLDINEIEFTKELSRNWKDLTKEEKSNLTKKIIK